MGTWSDDQVRLVVEAAARGGARGGCECGGGSQASPCDGPGPIAEGSSARVMQSGPEIENGILFFKNTSGTTIGVFQAKGVPSTSPTAIIEVVYDIDETAHTGGSSMVVEDGGALAITVFDAIEDMLELVDGSTTKRCALIVWTNDTGIPGSGSGNINTFIQTVPEGWTSHLFQVAYGATSSSTTPTGLMARAVDTATGRVLEQWFLRSDTPLPAASGTVVKWWLTAASTPASSRLDELKTGSPTWICRTARYHLVACKAK